MNYWDIIQREFPDLKLNRIICLMEFGSHLYGTNNKDSDRDYKGVFIPSPEQIILGTIPKSYHYSSGQDDSKNDSQDVDIEIYSLNYFLKLAVEGQTVAIDMLHNRLGYNDASMNPNFCIWADLHYKRSKFHTKNLSAFVSYARKQAAKYGIKGSRLSDCKKVIDFLREEGNQVYTIWALWDRLPSGEHIHKLPPNPADKSQQEIYQVVGKKFPIKTPIDCVISTLERYYTNYGARAQLAAENKGIDWKAVSHALRAAHQVKEILTTGDLIFPLKTAPILRAVKEGKLSYLAVVAPALECLMDELERLSESSELPDKVDRKYWDRWLIETITHCYGWEIK